MSDSTTSTTASWTVAGFRIPVPHPAFALSPHGSGKWQKRVRGKLVYFGNWARRDNGKLVPVPGWGWDEAEREYLRQAADLKAGRVPGSGVGPGPAGATVAEVCNQFLTEMLRRLGLTDAEIRALHALGQDASWTRALAGRQGRKMSPGMAAEYRATCRRLCAAFGGQTAVAALGPRHFSALHHDLARAFGPVRLGNEVQRVKTVFKWGYENDAVAAVPKYGSGFAKPGKDELRKHRAARGPRLFTADEVRRLLDGAPNPQLKAMILLGVNCAYGNTDVGALPLAAVDMAGGWATFPRPKNGIDRRAKLWPETVAALALVTAGRTAGTIFLTCRGRPFGGSAVAHEFGRLLRKLGINGRGGLGFYSLRHTFRTIADGAKDVGAIRLTMGHTDGAIDATYTHAIDDSRLEAVAAHVRAWLFG
jgi:integrase